MNRRQFSLFAMASMSSLLSISVKSSASTASQSNSVVTAFGFSHKKAKGSQPKCLFSASNNDTDQHFISRIALDKSLGFSEFSSFSGNIESIEIPFRAHDTLPLSPHQSLSFSRRPQNQMVICDYNNRQQEIVKSAEGRHFYGHGCIQKNQNILFTTENDYENARGVIGIRDAKTLRQLGEYESFGVGPHDIQLMPDNKTLVVANGGIETHPDYGRRKLNLKTMQPSLVFIDSETGKKIDEYRLDNHQLSIRHLSVSPQGKIAVATQYQGTMHQGKVHQGTIHKRTMHQGKYIQGKLNSHLPDYLCAVFDQDLRPMKHSQDFTRACKGYIGDVSIDSKAHIMAATSPRGNNINLWNIKQQRLIKTIALSGVCGICFDEFSQSFIASNAQGGIYQIPLNRDSLELSKIADYSMKWDNHMKLSS